MEDVTRFLHAARAGDPGAAERLAERVYDELHRMARDSMRDESIAHTLQPTALVHEAWMRLFGKDNPTFENRAHFFGAAATAIRRVLVDHARRQRSEKRRAGGVRVDIEVDAIPLSIHPDALIQVDDALASLATADPERARLVELRFFAGLTLDEVACVLEVSRSTVARDWRVARAWLRSELDLMSEAPRDPSRPAGPADPAHPADPAP